MRALLLTLIVLAQVIIGPQGQVITEPPEYADGVYCTPSGDLFKGVQTPDHPCSCKNMYRDRDGDENCCDERVTNDYTCKQWCHEQHCSCPHICIPGKPDETATPQEPPQ